MDPGDPGVVRRVEERGEEGSVDLILGEERLELACNLEERHARQPSLFPFEESTEQRLTLLDIPLVELEREFFLELLDVMLGP